MSDKQFIFKTERLLLREFNLSDIQKMFDLNSDPEVLLYTCDLAFVNLGEAKRFLQEYNEYEKTGFGRWAVIHKLTGEFIGWCGLKFNEEELIDVGFRFFKSEWGKGYATEAARGCLNYGFQDLGINEIVGRVAKGNFASIKVLKKLGMKYWKSVPCDDLEMIKYYKLSKG